MKEKILAIVERTTRAIDHTPIHYFRAVRTIKNGTVIRWDVAEQKLVLDDEGFAARDNIEERV